MSCYYYSVYKDRIKVNTVPMLPLIKKDVEIVAKERISTVITMQVGN